MLLLQMLKFESWPHKFVLCLTSVDCSSDSSIGLSVYIFCSLVIEIPETAI